MLVVDNASHRRHGGVARRRQPVERAGTLAENTGGAGGFHDGLAWAMERGADLVWLMDDDGLPDPDCLGRLLEHARTSTSGGRWSSTRTPDRLVFPIRLPVAPASCTGWPRSGGRRGRA